MEEFNVKLERFEGPYTKLLEMIESRKLSITEIGIVSVADDYIAYIKKLQTENDNTLFVDISQFIVVASTLMLMKAKSLLPGVVYTEEEEKQVHNLEAKLELFSVLNKLSSRIKSIFLKSPLLGRPRIKYNEAFIFVPDKSITKENLHSVAVLTVASFRTPPEFEKVFVEQKIRIENVIDSLLERIRKAQDKSFFSMVHNVTHSFEDKKKNLIVNFLALLELIRIGSIDAVQSENSGDITVASK